MKISYNRYYIVCAAVVSALYMIKNCHVDDAVEQINQSEYGAHHLVIYPDIRVLRQLYTKYVKKQLEDENKIVLMLPHYETTDNLRKILFATEEAKKYEDSFIAMDSLKGHFGLSSHMAFVNELVKRAENSSKNGVLVIADAGPFFHLNKRDKLMEHELSMPSQFDINLKRLCVFHKQDFNRLTEEQRQKLVKHHRQVLMLEDR
ncbi:MAG: hypothetical protein ACJ71K_13070 [Nitrososphaeraceae archaeon]